MKKLFFVSLAIIGTTYGIGYGIGSYLYQVGGIITAYADPVNQTDIDYSNGSPVFPDYQLQPSVKTYPIQLGVTKTTDPQFQVSN